MFLKNYTSGVPVSQTIYRIEQVLIRCGVSGITKEYSPTGEVVAVVFHIALTGAKPVPVRLPADVSAATDAFWADYCETHKTEWKRKKKRSDFADQAARTAWKIAQDWIEVEMSRIQMRQGEPLEIFMSYVWDGNRGQTYYAALKESQFKGLLPEKCE
jgi:hypothetical protein